MKTGSKARLALCIPARNAAGHLPRLLESVQLQTTPFDEVLLFDDASDDQTGALARDFGAVVVRSKVNVGPSVGKNVLAQQAVSEWLHFHDADDRLAPEFVARTRAWLARDDFDAVLFGTEDRDEETNATLGSRRWDDEALRLDPVRYSILHTVTNCGVYRRASFIDAGGFEASSATKYNEDQAMHIRLALNGLRFRADAYPGVIISRRRASMSSGHPIECARAHFEVLAQTSARTGTRYAQEVGERLWRLAGVLGGYQDWTYVRKCIGLASELGYVDPRNEDPMFRLAARVSPFGAVVAREAFIRVFKPALRREFPAARQ